MTLETLPTISVVIPVFNGEESLKRCIDSVIADPWPNKEIIIDDGSTDSTAHLSAQFALDYPQLIQFHTQENAGANSARNNGLNIATGKYVQFLDADDELTNSKLHRSLVIFSQNPQLCCVYTDATLVIDGVAGKLISADHNSIALLADHSAHQFTCALQTNLPIWKRQFLIDNALFWNETLPCWQESEYHVRILLKLGDSSLVHHLKASCARFYRNTLAAGISSGYWSERYILGQRAAVRLLYQHCCAYGMDNQGVGLQLRGYFRRLAIRSIVGHSKAAWSTISVDMSQTESSLVWLVFCKMPFPLLRRLYGLYKFFKQVVLHRQSSRQLATY